MRVKWMQAVFTVIGIAALSGAAAQAQTDTAGQTQTSPAGPAQTSSAGRPRANAGSESEFDIGASFYKAFNHSSSGYGTVQTPKNSAGGMLEVRYIDKPLVGFEFTYAYNPADQTFARTAPELRPKLYLQQPGDGSESEGERNRIGLGAVEKVWQLQTVRRGRPGLFHHFAGQQRLQRKHRCEAGVHLRRRRGLGLSFALRLAVSVSRQPVQGSQSLLFLPFDRHFYTHGGADGRHLHALLASGREPAKWKRTRRTGARFLAAVLAAGADRSAVRTNHNMHGDFRMAIRLQARPDRKRPRFLGPELAKCGGPKT